MHVGSAHLVTRFVVAASVAAVLLAGCSSGNGENILALPIEPILLGDIAVVPDATGTRAVVEVSTSIPLACAVAYGLDESFGSVAVDDDMLGGAHEDHSPLLTGLVPDTEYTYVLQGTDARGRFYRSDVLTFRTPAASASTRTDGNIAPEGSVVAASSSFSERFDASLAIDGDLTTEWSSDGDGDDAWIEIVFEDETDVVGFGLRSRSMSDGTSIIETYEVLVDDELVLGPFSADDDYATVDPAVSGRTFRFDAVATTGGNTGAAEILVHAPG